jgi:hypothetical protein
MLFRLSLSLSFFRQQHPSTFFWQSLENLGEIVTQEKSHKRNVWSRFDKLGVKEFETLLPLQPFHIFNLFLPATEQNVNAWISSESFTVNSFECDRSTALHITLTGVLTPHLSHIQWCEWLSTTHA